MNRSVRRICVTLIAISLAGCHSTMSNPPSFSENFPGGGFDNSSARWPLEFRAHYIGVATYSTYDCKITYDGALIRVDEEGVLKRSSESLGAKYPDGVLSAGHGPHRNFPGPMVITWRSKDGEPHHAEVDIGEIFRDQRVRHNVPREEVTEHGNDTAPGIIVEVNDRTINVYMRATIGLKRPRFSDRPHSDYRDDLIKVHTRIY